MLRAMTKRFVSISGILILAGLLAATGCRRSYKYYQTNPQIQVQGPSCQEQCAGAPNYLVCFARCPGVVRTAGTCSQMRLDDPDACIERREFSLGKTLIVFGVLGLIVLGGVVAAGSTSSSE